MEKVSTSLDFTLLIVILLQTSSAFKGGQEFWEVSFFAVQCVYKSQNQSLESIRPCVYKYQNHSSVCLPLSKAFVRVFRGLKSIRPSVYKSPKHSSMRLPCFPSKSPDLRKLLQFPHASSPQKSSWPPLSQGQFVLCIN